MKNKVLEKFKTLIENNVSCINFYKLLYDHNCFYLLSLFDDSKYRNVSKIAMAINKARIKLQYKYVQEITLLFSKKNIKYAIVKGAVLSKAAYNDIGYRMSTDIDILIERSQSETVRDILLSEGFVQGRVLNGRIVPFSRTEQIFYSSTSHQLAPFVKNTNNEICPFVIIDINFDIYWSESNISVDIRQVLHETIMSSLLSTKIQKLNPEMEFICLCLHHYKDMNSLYMLYTDHLKLSIFSDIYFYILNQNLDIHKLSVLANSFGAQRYIYYCLYYTKELFDDEILNDYLKTFISDEAIVLLDKYGLTDSEQKNWTMGFFDRLFIDNMYEYLNFFLGDKDKEKIDINNKYL